MRIIAFLIIGLGATLVRMMGSAVAGEQNHVLVLNDSGSVTLTASQDVELDKWTLDMLLFIPQQKDYIDELYPYPIAALQLSGDSKRKLQVCVRQDRKSRYAFGCAVATPQGIQGKFLRTQGLLRVNAWHHFTIVFLGADITVYLNGDLLGTVAAPALSGKIRTRKIVIGGRPPSTAGAAYRIDNIRLWQRAMQPNNMQRHEPAKRGLVAYLPFETGAKPPAGLLFTADRTNKPDTATAVIARAASTLDTEAMEQQRNKMIQLNKALAAAKAKRTAAAVESSKKMLHWKFCVPGFVTAEKSLLFTDPATMLFKLPVTRNLDGISFSMWLFIPTRKYLAQHQGNRFYFGIKQQGKFSPVGLCIFDCPDRKPDSTYLLCSDCNGGSGAGLGDVDLRYGQWNHFVFTMDAKQLRLYANGKPSTTKSPVTSPDPIPYIRENTTISFPMQVNEIFVGFESPTHKAWNGTSIADVQVWDRVLTLDEIRYAARQRFRKKEDGLLAYVDFVEGRPREYMDNCKVSLNGRVAYAIRQNSMAGLVDRDAVEKAEMEAANKAFTMQVPLFVQKRKSVVFANSGNKTSHKRKSNGPPINLQNHCSANVVFKVPRMHEGISFGMWIWIPKKKRLNALPDNKASDYLTVYLNEDYENELVTKPLGHPFYGFLFKRKFADKKDEDDVALKALGTVFEQTSEEAGLRLGAWNYLALTVRRQDAIICVNGRCTLTDLAEFARPLANLKEISISTLIMPADKRKSGAFAIHDFRIWNRGLSAIELQDSLSKTYTRGADDLECYVNFRKGKPAAPCGGDDVSFYGWRQVSFAKRK